MNNANRTIVSRRARPAKEPLSREVIVKQAFLLLREEGISGLSMRKVAKALDTGASSLYVYVKDLQELSSYVLDYGLTHVELPDTDDGSWKSNLFAALLSYQQVLYKDPGIAELALTTTPLGPHSLDLSEYLLKQLAASGIQPASAAWAMDLLLMYAASSAFEHVSWSKNEKRSFTLMKEAYLSADASRFPFIHSHKSELFSGDLPKDERFLWGLEVILQGTLKLDHGME
ncbi:TetR/AcrR family transcriptional regulator [Paenibacillus graminis]|uniref:TetR family transcriptional regulator n=1 Tax=Paenibacillus graminis TaxID=189425 RepID=A0A089M1X0_9BACL|nr:TetR/AcrR family transcriptional regulator C-terminal domain-containing protein [Paenibacillus graminis]AIQ67766.1 TetR family transcriptional regulator [Paenibacillus graminis]